MFSPFFSLVKIVCRSAPLSAAIIPFRSVVQSGSSVKVWVPGEQGRSLENDIFPDFQELRIRIKRDQKRRSNKHQNGRCHCTDSCSSPFFHPRKNRLQKCTLCTPPFFPFRSHRPIRELGENRVPPGRSGENDVLPDFQELRIQIKRD
ncbi:hypothetical protein CEXT_98581 [Caerostris extrusa]|uniref:Uncharacterized protein n=1 Tax=Caerostris extrusa TaxID=172846 RepID=A0AAV4XIE6_CAEEX|nr:hypothetical protein CEXT_98581 [Caerostris extrusa]